MSSIPPRPWPIAALAGAYGVIVPAALAFAAWRLVETRRTLGMMAGFGDLSEAEIMPRALQAGLGALGGGLLVASLVGIPLALLLCGVLAWLEGRWPPSHTFGAWLIGAAVLAVLLGGPLMLLAGALWVGLLPLLFCLLGAAIAWAVRHRAFSRARA